MGRTQPIEILWEYRESQSRIISGRDAVVTDHGSPAPDPWPGLRGEHSFLFGPAGARRYGYLHLPDEPAGSLGVVICPPCGAEGLFSRRALAQAARTLCGLGHRVLRFDYLGEGESEGDPDQLSPTSAAADIRVATDLLMQTGAQRLVLLGLRTGGAFTLLAARDLPPDTLLVLWDPVVDLKSYVADSLRQVLASATLGHGPRHTRTELEAVLARGESVNVSGMSLGSEFAAQARSLDITGLAAGLTNSSLVLANGSDQGQALAALLSVRGRCELRTAECEPFWLERASQSLPHAFSQETASWLADTCGAKVWN